ncbi:MAG: response regulator transcription factor [Saprospiraceae bacterium]|nr:response regulator transcription factor [Saprospiraceae bacterium]
MAKKAKILIVDDEQDIVEFLSYNLEKEGFKVKTAFDGAKAIEKAKKFNPHLIILDIMMPEMNGIEVCEKLRADDSFKDTLIVFLTARAESFTQIAALDSGGDDFINKPIKPSVLKSRINAILRRHDDFKKMKGDVIKYGNITIDYEKYVVKVKKEKISLAKKEFELLSLLSSKPGKVFKRAEILSKVWGHEVIVGDRTIDVHIRKLREKIGSSYIKTMKGVGYKFEF